MNHHVFSKYTLILCRDCGFSLSILKQQVAGSKIDRHMKSIIIFMYGSIKAVHTLCYGS
jgi:hypothetical protein